MTGRLFAHLRRQWMGALALFLVLTGGIAYAAGTIGSADVIDNSLRSIDLKDESAVKTEDIIDGQVKKKDLGVPATYTSAGSAWTLYVRQCNGVVQRHPLPLQQPGRVLPGPVRHRPPAGHRTLVWLDVVHRLHPAGR